MTAIVLAGGKATRMGGSCDKAFLKVGGETIINRQLSALKKLFDEIIIVTNFIDNYRFLEGVRVIPDVIPGLGPLGGIYSGLLASASRYNFIVACDMPFISEALVRYLVKSGHKYDILIPQIDGKPHPLFVIYSKKCIPVIEKSLKGNRLKVSSIFPQLKTKFILKGAVKKFDKNMFSLLNINTPDELRRVKK